MKRIIELNNSSSTNSDDSNIEKNNLKTELATTDIKHDLKADDLQNDEIIKDAGMNIATTVATSEIEKELIESDPVTVTVTESC